MELLLERDAQMIKILQKTLRPMLTKGTAVFVCAAFLMTSIAMPKARAEVPSNKGFSRPVVMQEILIPPELGLITESFHGTSGKTILFIQDAHDSLEAQENIAKIINHVVSGYGVQTVFEEGYEGPVPTDRYFGFIKDPKIKEKVVYFLMDHLRVGGAEYAHINRAKDFNLIGADSLKLHKENIDQYRFSAAKKDVITKDLKTLERELKALTDARFPKELKEWLKSKRQFDAKTLDLFTYLGRTMPLLGEPGAEKGLGLIGFLIEAMKTNDPAVIEQAKHIDAREVFGELIKLEKAVAETYLHDTADKQLFEYYKILSLLNRLNALQVSQEEYEAAKASLKAFDTDSFGRFIFSQTPKTLILSRMWERNIKDAVRFYEIAQERDYSLSQMLGGYSEGRNKKEELVHKQDISVLVFGGFHKEAIKRILEAKGISYLVVSPHITRSSPRHEEFYKRLMTDGHLSYELPMNLNTASRPWTQFEIWNGNQSLAKSELRIMVSVAENMPNVDTSSLILAMEQALKNSTTSTRSEVRNKRLEGLITQLKQLSDVDDKQIRRAYKFAQEATKGPREALLLDQAQSVAEILVREYLPIAGISDPQEITDLISAALLENVPEEARREDGSLRQMRNLTLQEARDFIKRGITKRTSAKVQNIILMLTRPKLSSPNKNDIVPLDAVKARNKKYEDQLAESPAVIRRLVHLVALARFDYEQQHRLASWFRQDRWTTTDQDDYELPWLENSPSRAPYEIARARRFLKRSGALPQAVKNHFLQRLYNQIEEAVSEENGRPLAAALCDPELQEAASELLLRLSETHYGKVFEAIWFGLEQSDPSLRKDMLNQVALFSDSNFRSMAVQLREGIYFARYQLFSAMAQAVPRVNNPLLLQEALLTFTLMTISDDRVALNEIRTAIMATEKRLAEVVGEEQRKKVIEDVNAEFAFELIAKMKSQEAPVSMISQLQAALMKVSPKRIDLILVAYPEIMMHWDDDRTKPAIEALEARLKEIQGIQAPQTIAQLNADAFRRSSFEAMEIIVPKLSQDAGTLAMLEEKLPDLLRIDLIGDYPEDKNARKALLIIEDKIEECLGLKTSPLSKKEREFSWREFSWPFGWEPQAKEVREMAAMAYLEILEEVLQSYAWGKSDQSKLGEKKENFEKKIKTLLGKTKGEKAIGALYLKCLPRIIQPGVRHGSAGWYEKDAIQKVKDFTPEQADQKIGQAYLQTLAALVDESAADHYSEGYYGFRAALDSLEIKIKHYCGESTGTQAIAEVYRRHLLDPIANGVDPKDYIKTRGAILGKVWEYLPETEIPATVRIAYQNMTRSALTSIALTKPVNRNDPFQFKRESRSSFFFRSATIEEEEENAAKYDDRLGALYLINDLLAKGIIDNPEQALQCVSLLAYWMVGELWPFEFIAREAFKAASNLLQKELKEKAPEAIGEALVQALPRLIIKELECQKKGGLLHFVKRIEEKSGKEVCEQRLRTILRDNFIQMQSLFLKDPNTVAAKEVATLVQQSLKTDPRFTNSVYASRLTVEEQFAVYDYLQDVLNGKSPEKSEDAVFEKIAKLLSERKIWDSNDVVRPFESGADTFGYSTMFSYISNRENRHAVLVDIESVARSYKRLTSEQKALFVQNVMLQVPKDTSTDSEGLDSYRRFTAIASSYDPKWRDALQALNLMHPSFMRLLETFAKDPLREFRSLKDFEQMGMLNKIIQRKEILGSDPMKGWAESKDYESRRLWSYMMQLLFNGTVHDLSALIGFIRNPNTYWASPDGHAPAVIQAGLGPHQYITGDNYIDLTGEELRNGGILGQRDQSMAFRPMVMDFYTVLDTWGLDVLLNSMFWRWQEMVYESNFFDSESLVAYLHRIFPDQSQQITAENASEYARKNLRAFYRKLNVPGLLKQGVALKTEYQRYKNQMLEGGAPYEIRYHFRQEIISRSVRLKSEKEEKWTASDREFMELMKNRLQNQGLGERFRAEIYAKSDPRSKLVGHEAPSCMGIGTGKEAAYDAQQNTANFAITTETTDELGRPYERTVVTSVMTMNRSVGMNVEEFFGKVKGVADLRALNLYKLLKDTNFENTVGTYVQIAADNVEGNPNFIEKIRQGKIIGEGKTWEDFVEAVYRGFWETYIHQYPTTRGYDPNAQGLPIRRSSIFIGTANNDYLNSLKQNHSVENTTLPQTFLTYTDNGNAQTMELKLGLGDELPARNVTGIRSLNYEDTLEVAYLEGKVYQEFNFSGGVAKVQNELMAISLNEAIKGKKRKNLSRGFYHNGKLVGYLIAYIGFDPKLKQSIVYVNDWVVDPKERKKGASGALLLSFFREVKKDFSGLPIVGDLRQGRAGSYDLIRNHLGAGKYGYSISEDGPSEVHPSLRHIVIKSDKAGSENEENVKVIPDGFYSVSRDSIDHKTSRILEQFEVLTGKPESHIDRLIYDHDGLAIAYVKGGQTRAFVLGGAPAQMPASEIHWLSEFEKDVPQNDIFAVTHLKVPGNDAELSMELLRQLYLEVKGTTNHAYAAAMLSGPIKNQLEEFGHEYRNSPITMAPATNSPIRYTRIDLQRLKDEASFSAISGRELVFSSKARSEVRKSAAVELSQLKISSSVATEPSPVVIKSKATTINPWKVLQLEQDMVAVVEQARIDTLLPEMFKELLEVAGLNKDKLHLVIPDALQGKYSERVAELRKVASVHDGFPQLAASDKVPVIGFSDMERDTLTAFQKRLDPRLAEGMKDSVFGFNRPGSFGVGILYALKDIPPDRLSLNRNGFRYDRSGWYLAQVLEVLQAYTVISTSA